MKKIKVSYIVNIVFLFLLVFLWTNSNSKNEELEVLENQYKNLEEEDNKLRNIIHQNNKTITYLISSIRKASLDLKNKEEIIEAKKKKRNEEIVGLYTISDNELDSLFSSIGFINIETDGTRVER